MEQTIYFSDKSVIFTHQASLAGCRVVACRTDEDLFRDKILKILETENCVTLLSDDPGRAFGVFAAQFTPVEAAGGVVVNHRGEWLMIRRNGRWDLPKGHVEAGETCEVCAVREIAEETGVCRTQVVRPLCETYHAYYFPKTARWELKRTHWYELRAGACEGLVPQAEEGIERVAWCAPAEVAANLREAFPTIRCVAAAMSGS